MSWINDFADQEVNSQFGLIINAGLKYVFEYDLNNEPKEITKVFEGKESKYWQFDIELVSQTPIVNDDGYCPEMAILKRDNQKRYDYLMKQLPGSQKLELSRTQTILFSKFLRENCKLESKISNSYTISLIRTGSGKNTKYNFKMVEVA